MKALIMAAGKGTRISRYIKGKPKCTVNIGNSTLIEYTIQELHNRGITDIAIVLGYEATVLEELLSQYGVKFYYNYFYDVTNSIASAWFAKDFIDDDIVMMNADVFLETSLIDEVFTDKKSPVLFADSSHKEEADYKFCFDNGVLLKFGKNLSGDDISGEYVGIAKMKKEYLPDFLDRLENFIKKGYHDMWWEDVIYSFVEEREIYVEDINGKFWAEVDYVEDYRKILDYRQVLEDDGII